MDAPPLDPDDWSDEQWQEYLRVTAEAEDDEPALADLDASFHRRAKESAGGAVIGAAMMGLQQALYGDLPKEDVVVEAESDDPDRDRSVFDPDDPSSSTISLTPEPPAGT